MYRYSNFTCKRLQNLLFALSYQSSQTGNVARNVMQVKNGGPCRARTYDPLIKSQLLYQLS